LRPVAKPNLVDSPNQATVHPNPFSSKFRTSPVDAWSGAVEMLNPRTKSWGMFEVTRQKAEQLLELYGRVRYAVQIEGRTRWEAARVGAD
jgi:hypothetical protein